MCIGRSSSLVCDGEPDCIFGEDEAADLCNTQPQPRGPRKIDLTDVSPKMETDVLQPVAKYREIVSTNIDLRMILAMFLGTFISVVCFCLAIIFVMFKLSRKAVKQQPEAGKPYPPFQRQTSANNQ